VRIEVLVVSDHETEVGYGERETKPRKEG